MGTGAARLHEEKRELPLCSRESLRVLDRCAQAMWIYSFGQERIVWANDPGQAFWNATRDEDDVRLRNVRPTSPGVIQRLENLRHRLFIEDRAEELWTLYPNGVPKSAMVSAALVRLEDRDLGLLFEVLPQATVAEPQGHAHHAELRAIEAVNHAPLMISMMTPAGSWLMHNPAGEALVRRLGHSNVPNFDNFLALFDDRAQAGELRDRALDTGKARGQLRIAGLLPRFHDVALRRIIDPVTGLPALMLSQMDITRSKVLERRLERALRKERAMSETQRHFLSLTSHEFRTPLAIIAGSVRRLRVAIGNQQTLADRLDVVAAAVARMQNAIDKTLWGGRIEAGKVPYHPGPVDLGEIARRAVALQQELHEDRAIMVDIAALPRITGDAQLIEQAIDNLLSNAIKFSPPAAPVEVRGVRTAQGLEISVQDHGVGVPGDDLPRLFSPFFRAGNARGVKGTGIGLMAVRHFMELHGGTVDLASHEGRGTCVTLRFPLPVA